MKINGAYVKSLFFDLHYTTLTYKIFSYTHIFVINNQLYTIFA